MKAITPQGMMVECDGKSHVIGCSCDNLECYYGSYYCVCGDVDCEKLERGPESEHELGAKPSDCEGKVQWWCSANYGFFSTACVAHHPNVEAAFEDGRPQVVSWL